MCIRDSPGGPRERAGGDLLGPREGGEGELPHPGRQRRSLRRAMSVAATIVARIAGAERALALHRACLLYTSPSPRGPY